MTVERGDFISLSYTGRLDNGDVFDTTDENVAKENGLLAEGVSYAPITIVVGENMVVKGLDEDLIGKKTWLRRADQNCTTRCFWTANP